MPYFCQNKLRQQRAGGHCPGIATNLCTVTKRIGQRKKTTGHTMRVIVACKKTTERERGYKAARRECGECGVAVRKLRFKLCAPPHDSKLDGPSAAAVVGMLSLASHRRVRTDVTVTGDVGPTGRIRKVGCIRQKFEPWRSNDGPISRTAAMPKLREAHVCGEKLHKDRITHWALQIMFECGCGKTMPCTFELMGNGKRRKWGLYTAFQVAEELHFVGQRSFNTIVNIYNGMWNDYFVLNRNCRTWYRHTMKVIVACKKTTERAAGLRLTGSFTKETRSALERGYKAARRECGECGVAVRKLQFELCAPPHDSKLGGPSATAAAVVGMLSLASHRRVRTDVAVTGDVGPTGRIRKVGCIRQKVQGAVRAGIRTVFLPHANRKNFEDIPKKDRKIKCRFSV
uniref:Lon proteolytic domain-containing protein n=1 Tax=Globodera pallida TaxID=36090 RepID=A0A183BYV7_GLOPA